MQKREQKEYESDNDSDLDAYEDWEKVLNPANIINANELDDDCGIKKRSEKEMQEDDLFAMDETNDNVQFMAVRPYIGALVAPSDFKGNNASAPNADMEIDWVYGYRAYDSRSNVVYNSVGELVYPVAGVVVIYNPKTHSQRVFQGHNDDVICLCQHPKDPDIVATGQVATIVNRRATNPHICVFNTRTGEKWVIQNAGKRAIRSVGFSADGNYLASVGDDNNFSVAVWDWKSGKKLAEEKGDTNKIFHLRWNHTGKPNEFVTVGKNHVYFWTYDGGKLKKSRGKLGKFDQVTFASIAFSDKGYACCGGQDGQMYVFVDGACMKRFPLHDGTIYTIDYTPGGILTGGKDGKVIVCNKKVEPINVIQFDGQIRSATVSGNDLIVGLSTGCIHHVGNFANNKKVDTPIVKGHYDGELWAICWSPKGDQFVTVGEDNMLVLWDPKTHRMIKEAPLVSQSKVVEKKKKGQRQTDRKRAKASSTTSHPPNQCARSIDWQPSGQHLAIGNNEGHLIVVDAKTLTEVCDIDLNNFGKRNVKNQDENWIQTLKYSPNGKVLAVGTHGMVIVLLDVEKGYSPAGTLKRHNAALTNIDFSADSKHIKSNCIAYELIFHDINLQNLAKTQQNQSPKTLKDVEWSSFNCPLDWATHGIFDPDMDGTDVNTCDADKTRKLLVTGDDFGQVNLFRFPCSESGNDRRRKNGHSSHVMAVRFSPDGKRIVSVGGNDKAIIQWKVVA